MGRLSRQFTAILAEKNTKHPGRVHGVEELEARIHHDQQRISEGNRQHQVQGGATRSALWKRADQECFDEIHVTDSSSSGKGSTTTRYLGAWRSHPSQRNPVASRVIIKTLATWRSTRISTDMGNGWAAPPTVYNLSEGDAVKHTMLKWSEHALPREFEDWSRERRGCTPRLSAIKTSVSCDCDDADINMTYRMCCVTVGNSASFREGQGRMDPSYAKKKRGRQEQLHTAILENVVFDLTFFNEVSRHHDMIRNIIFKHMSTIAT